MSLSLKVKKVIFMYERPFLGMLHIVNKISESKLKSKDPPRPHHGSKIKLAYMKGQVSLKIGICTTHKPINKKELNLI